MEQVREFFNRLNQDYLKVHKKKEDLYWDIYMAISDDEAAFSQAEQAYKAFVSDPVKLAEVRAQLAALESAPGGDEKNALQHGLRGWLDLFESNIISNDKAAGLQAELIEMEAALFGKRRSFTMYHINDKGERAEASLGALATNITVNPSEEARKSSLDELHRLEYWVIENGFLDIVAKRNEFAQALGYRDFFDYKVRLNEKLSPEELFAILEDFEDRTREASLRAERALAAEKGENALLPHNLMYYVSGDIRRQLDSYMPFSAALERWILSFRRLGITFRGALMQLDLLERKGKYENGFCHGPIPTFYDGEGNWIAGQINFTSLAKPDQVGSGSSALNTLFHEGGHAAHFANVTQNSPCFSQEFAPTSMAYAETQSMFCDSILGDADWLKLYAKNADGEPVPDALIRARIEKTQPWRARSERSMLAVPYFERALYAMSEADRTPDAVIALARATERRIYGGNDATRPLLSIPHLLNQESAAAYHGYLLAHMAVYQTRDYFTEKFGYLTDNPAIGPLLAEHYWGPGNSVNHNATLISLTGKGFSADALAARCNQSIEDAWAEAESQIAGAATRDYPADYPASLDATIRIVHGATVVADNSISEEAMCEKFAAWVGQSS